MKTVKCLVGLLMCLFSTALLPPPSAAEVPSILVGRILHIEGDLLRYVPEERDWVAVVRDAPFGVQDTLFSGNDGAAELILPNGIWTRVGNGTQIQFITLDPELVEADVFLGTARFHNRGSQAVIKITSPFGYVLANPGTVFDFYVGDDSVEVVAIQGTVTFIHPSGNARYDVVTGAPSILADQQYVSSGEGTVDPDWNRWNMARENIWLARSEAKGPSGDYLPPALRYDARTFDENGRWEKVPYEGAERLFWRPTTVAVGWSPFTVGRWTDWYGDHCWIPAEPFGYVTHHYGNWVYVRNHWYWAPPVVSVRIGFPLLDVGFFWSPGRVAWIHSGIYVGWVPLAPREAYYARRHWGDPHTVVVNHVTINRINIHVRDHAYINHSVIVRQNHFYSRNNYRTVRVTNINRTGIIDHYRAAPVISSTVIRNYETNKQRHNLTNVTIREKPHSSVINRIHRAETIRGEGRKENAAVLQERLKRLPEGKIHREARIEQPRGTNYLVPARQVNRPKSEVTLQQREIKRLRTAAPQVRPSRTERPERVAPVRPPQPERPALRPERVTPGAIPVQPERTRPESVAPSRPVRQERPVQPESSGPGPQRVVPARPAQPERTRPERVAPARPPQPEQPAARPERVTPGAIPVRPEQTRQESIAPSRPVRQERPVQPESSGPGPERVAPARPAQPERTRPERVAPARPPQPEQPAARPERVTPGAIPVRPEQTRQESIAPSRPVRQERPVQPESSGPGPERVAPARPAPPERTRPERVAPVRPPQPEQPAARPAGVTPEKSAKSERAKPERAAPEEAVQREKSDQSDRSKRERGVPEKQDLPGKMP